MASTTKIMTCILALEYGKLDSEMTVSAYAASQQNVNLVAYKGETFYLRDLLYSLMLESHNDAAVIIAENIGGSVEGFADMMNAKAKELGCGNTYFITPNGLDAADENGSHHTTAEDLARIMKYCIMDSPQKEMFLEITRTPSYQFTDCSGKSTYSCTNHNAFLQMMDGALSGKQDLREMRATVMWDHLEGMTEPLSWPCLHAGGPTIKATIGRTQRL